MSLKNKFSILLSFLLCSSPFSTLAQSAITIRPEQVPAVDSLQTLNSFQIDGQSLEQGRDYDLNVQYSSDHANAYVCYTFKNGYGGQVVKKHAIGDINGFQDVEPDYYAIDSINYASDLGWVKGREDGNFYPRDNLSRGEFVTILYRLSGSPQEEVHEHFTDIDPANPVFYTWPALWAAKHGIIKGYSDAYGHVFFKGDNPITRQELALMLHRYQGEDGSSTTLDEFKDSSAIGDPYLNGMKWCVEHGIISGSDGNLNPKGNASRAQVVTMLARFNKAKVQNESLLSSALAKIQAQSENLTWLAQSSSPASLQDEDSILTGQLVEPETDKQDREENSSENTSDLQESQQPDLPESENSEQDGQDAEQSEPESEDVTLPDVQYGWKGEQFISFETGKPVTGWLFLDGNTYYFDEQGNLIKNNYQQIGEQVYNLDAQGKVTPGFVLLNNRSYYFSQYDGHRQVGKKYFDGTEYRLFTEIDEEGTLQEENGQTICLFSDGSRAHNEELSIGGNFYYFDGYGNAAKDRWIERDEKSYYYGADGKKLIGQSVKLQDDKTVYFDFYDGRSVDETEWIAQREAKAVMDEVGTDIYALFMWVVHNLTFNSDVSHDLSTGEYGRMAFEKREGNCYVFTAAFYYFAYLSGYDPIYIRGSVMYDVKNELWGDHSWCAIRDEEGKLWYYDPDSERNLGHIVTFWHIDPYHLPVNLKADPDMLP